MRTQNKIFLVLFFLISFILGSFALPQRFLPQNIKKLWFFSKPFKLGLDLKGGISLLYEVDFSQIPKEKQGEVLRGLREIIERRINIFGIKEPSVHVEGEKRLRIEVAGAARPEEAIKIVGEAPFLEFREEMNEEEKKRFLESLPKDEIKRLKKEAEENFGTEIKEDELWQYLPLFKPTELTGKYLKRASLEFNPTTYEPEVLIEFDKEGAKIFEKLTEKNWHKPLAIFIDGNLISAPIVGKDDPSPKGSIKGGRAVISGNFSVEEAKKLAQNLNAGALPAPVKLIAIQTIGPTLGKEALDKALIAGILGILAVLFGVVIFYKFGGLISSLSLIFYGILILFIFKNLQMTLTLSGVAGFILGFGMAIDGNILVMERLKEEIKKEKRVSKEAVDKSFKNAWLAIRDGNLTTLIICVILFYISSGFVQGFAFALGLSNAINLFSVMVISKFLYLSFLETRLSKLSWIWTR